MTHFAEMHSVISVNVESDYIVLDVIETVAFSTDARMTNCLGEIGKKK